MNRGPKFKYIYLNGICMSEYEIITGTSVGVKASDGVVLASEKRIAYGFYLLSKSGKKLFKVTDKVGMVSSGVLADMQVISKLIRANITMHEMEAKRPASTRAVAKLLSQVLFQSRYMPFLVEVMVGGVDESGPHLIVLDAAGALIEDDFAALGTGARTAIGIIETSYRQGIGVNDARMIAINAVREASYRDAVSGDGVDLMTITKDGIREETVPIAQPAK